jgi:hypothetical protein
MISTYAAAAAAALAIAGLAAPSFAAPAQAGSDVCRASAPAAGAVVEGAVLHVADGQSVCVAQGPTPDEWIPLVIEGPSPVDRHDPMLTKAAMMSAVFGKKMSCRVTSTDGGVARATCSVDRKPVGLVVAKVTTDQAAKWLPKHS